ncbi:MAG: hypothetical protein SF053_06770 [Bacteroidia bacterium]|nr:hypothetical protein [Bacteroidia bacterium]
MRLGWLWVGIGLSLSASAQQNDSVYWHRYIQPVTVSEDSIVVSFPLLDTLVTEYEFFFSAEEHWKTINTRIQLALLLHLHQKAGVRNLILEGGYSYGFLINRFLETGDDRLLRRALTDLPVCPDDLEEMFESIYVFNQQLPPEDRIKVTGIDLEYSPELSLQTIHTLLPDSEPPAIIGSYISEVVSLHRSKYTDPKATRRFFRRFATHLSVHQRTYATWWGADYEIVKMIVDNTLMGYRFNILRASLFQQSWQEREAQMYQNFLQLQSRMQPGRYFAQFGALHTDIHRSPSWEFPTLANRLNNTPSSPVADKVFTISRYIRKMPARYEASRDYESLRQMISHVDDQFPRKVVLCNLIGESSPFQELSRNFQCLILIDPMLESASCE